MCIQAPEMILERGASAPQDIWSLGCLLFELVTGNSLFPADHAQLRHIFLKQVASCKVSVVPHAPFQSLPGTEKGCLFPTVYAPRYGAY